MAEDKKPKTKKPTGLTIERNGARFIVKWKIADKDYGDGQNAQYKIGTDEWKDLDVTSTTTKKAFPVKVEKYCPEKENDKYKEKLKSVKVRVKGNRKKYKDSKNKDINPEASDWAERTFDIDPPDNPKVTVTLVEWASATFTWKADVDKTSHKWFRGIEYNSVLLVDSTLDPSALLEKHWNGTASGALDPKDGTSSSSEGSKTIIENTSAFEIGKSYTRYFRIRSVGLAGWKTDKNGAVWRYAKHVYSDAQQAKITRVEKDRNDTVSGYTCQLWFTAPITKGHPIDKVITQYGLAVPDENMQPPDGISWSNGLTSIPRDTKQDSNSAIFTIDQLPALDQCLFVRINTVYDDRTTYGEPMLVDYGGLAEPSELTVQTDDQTFRATVTATNNSSVADSYLVITYKSKDYPTGIDIGVITRGQTSAIVQCPDWSRTPNKSFSVRAVVGDAVLDNADFFATEDTSIIASKVYCYKNDKRYAENVFFSYGLVNTSSTMSVNPSEEGWYEPNTTNVTRYSITPKMQSAVVDSGGNVPVAPKRIKAEKYDSNGTIRVTWDWEWDDADRAEISWSDHEDAWESTDEPSTYIVSKMKSSVLNISGLETGIKWYVRVRLIAGLDDEATYGPYSDPYPVELSSAPSIPSLEVSDPVITADGSTTASWGFVSTDGTGQLSADLVEVVDNQYLPIVTVTSQQYYEISAKELGWQTGTTHKIAVSVTSESGKVSEGWSVPVDITVADALECSLSCPSLVWQTNEINPQVYDGELVTFETDFEQPVTKLTTPLEPIQDTHGYDSAWIHNDNEQEPYIQRSIAGTVTDLGNYIYDTVVGGTVAWNQLWALSYAKSPNTDVMVTVNANSITISGTTSSEVAVSAYNTGAPRIPVLQGHKYLYDVGNDNATVKVGISGYDYAVSSKTKGIMVWTRASYLSGYGMQFSISAESYTSGMKFVPQFIDLTQMFGATIADYIYGLEQATAGAGVAWFRNLFPKSYYAYDTGSLQSVNTSEHVLMGNNLLPPMVKGTYTLNGVTAVVGDNNMVTFSGTASASGSLNIPLTETYIYSGEKICFHLRNSVSNANIAANFDNASGVSLIDIDMAPANRLFDYSNQNKAGYTVTRIRFWLTTNLTMSGTFQPSIETVSTATDYEPYSRTPYPLDSSLTLRGIPKLDNNNKLYYDGDTYESSGKVTRKYGVVDLGTLTWYYNTTYLYFYASLSNSKQYANTRSQPFVCTKYISVDDERSLSNTPDKSVYNAMVSSLYCVCVLDSAYTDAATFKTAMSGVYLVYELATPTTETATGFTNPQLIDGKTVEQYTDYALSQGTRDMAIPVGHQTDHANICPIYGRTGQTVTVTGENLYSRENGQYNVPIYATDGTSASYPDVNVVWIRVLPNTTYALALSPNSKTYYLRWIECDENKGFIWRSSITTSSSSSTTITKTYTTRANTKWIQIGVNQYAAAQIASNNWELSIVKSENATAYEPYTGTTYTRSFVDSQGNELTVYGGEDEIVGGVLTVTRKMITYDGDEAFSYNSSYNGFRAYVSDGAILGIPKNDLLSNTFVGANGRGTGTGTFVIRTYSGTTAADGQYIFFCGTGMTDVATFKAWLAETPTQVIYPLATPEVHQLSANEVETLIGTNHVWSDAGEVTVRTAEAVEDGYALKEMPLTATVTGIGDSGKSTLIVERRREYTSDRPNEDEQVSFEGETTILADDADSSGVFTIDNNSPYLFGRLDDGAQYTMYATVKDNLGQSAPSEPINFIVDWTDQAIIPEAEAEIDDEWAVAIITPVAPAGARESDTCDIYRLSVDKPELIYRGATFGETYVDPYPAIGQFGGHRFVMVTANGDYITEDQELAWVDTGEADGDILETEYSIIDFGTGRVMLDRNVDFGWQWTKDFKETHYLDGSVEGDYIAGVSRSGSINAVAITLIDQDAIENMRRLAVYTGECHVRTNDGSSFAANVDVQENYTHSTGKVIASFSMNVTRVEPQKLEGLTYHEWRKLHNGEL